MAISDILQSLANLLGCRETYCTHSHYTPSPPSDTPRSRGALTQRPRTAARVRNIRGSNCARLSSQLPTPNSQLPTPNSRTTPMDDPRRHPLPVRADLAANTLFNRRATPVDAQNPGGELCAPTHERPDFALPSPSSAVLSLNLPTTAAAPNRHFKQCRRGLSQFCGVFGAKWDGPSPQEW